MDKWSRKTEPVPSGWQAPPTPASPVLLPSVLMPLASSCPPLTDPTHLRASWTKCAHQGLTEAQELPAELQKAQWEAGQ